MNLEVSKKYAQALLDIASEHDEVEATLAEVDKLSQAVEESKLMKFIDNDEFSKNEKIKLINILSDNSSDLIKNLLRVIIENDRLEYLESIFEQIISRAKKILNQATVEVTSAVKLSDDQLEKIKNVCMKKFDLQKVDLEQTIDESIIGGVILKSNGKIIDTSISSQLKQIKEKMK
jgi:ATP synthase, F1 delta subunit